MQEFNVILDFVFYGLDGVCSGRVFEGRSAGPESIWRTRACEYCVVVISDNGLLLVERCDAAVVT